VATDRFQLVDQLPVFSFEGHGARFLLKPPMLGNFDRARLLTEDPGYGARAKEYQPIEVHIERLRAIQDPVVVRIYFGSWCSVCFEMMPHMVRIEEELKGSSVRFEYYGLPAGFDDPEAKRQNVGSVPTALVYRKGEEVGRLQGYSFSYPEMSIANLLSGIAVPDVGRPPSGR
jgi:thiol-disulfide isomerase/thioredoxin